VIYLEQAAIFFSSVVISALRKATPMIAFESPEPIRVHVGCSIEYESLYPTPMLLILSPGYNNRLTEEQRLISPEVPIHQYIDGFGNQIWRLSLLLAHCT